MKYVTAYCALQDPAGSENALGLHPSERARACPLEIDEKKPKRTFTIASYRLRI